MSNREPEIENIVAFCILMESTNGIIGKSPGYVREKFDRYVNGEADAAQWGLDKANEKKLGEWSERWK